jgi:HD-GYP domain-containing protein (c-di-GMP phosphodiesterase class II)
MSPHQVPWSLEARIVFIAETFDCLRSDSSYHKSKDPKEALSEMERGSGSQFDPEILAIFISNVQEANISSPPDSAFLD